VYIDLHDEVTLPSGETKTLRDELGGWVEGCGRERKETARIAAKFWDEYSKKQTLLSTYFAKGAAKSKTESLPDASTAIIPTSRDQASEAALLKSMDDQESEFASPTGGEIDDAITTYDEAALSSLRPTPPSLRPEDHPTKASLKRKKQEFDGSAVEQNVSRKGGSKTSEEEAKTGDLKVVKKAKSGQATLASFFNRPTASTPSQSAHPARERKKSSPVPVKTKNKSNTPQSAHSVSDESEPEIRHTTTKSKSSTTVTADAEKQLEEDYTHALSLTEIEDPLAASQKSSQGSSTSSRDAWSRLTAPIVPPRCTVHGEPTKQLTVNKAGPNKGKLFYTCSRSVLAFSSGTRPHVTMFPDLALVGRLQCEQASRPWI